VYGLFNDSTEQLVKLRDQAMAQHCFKTAMRIGQELNDRQARFSAVFRGHGDPGREAEPVPPVDYTPSPPYNWNAYSGCNSQTPSTERRR
jgi:hypothetical protein